ADEVNHIFTQVAADLESFSCIRCADKQAYLYGTFCRLDNLDNLNQFVPDIRGFHQPFHFRANGIHGNRVIKVQHDCAKNIGGGTCPVLEGLLDKIADGNDQAAQVPYTDNDIGQGDFLDPAPFSLHDNDIIDADGLCQGNLDSAEQVS